MSLQSLGFLAAKFRWIVLRLDQDCLLCGAPRHSIPSSISTLFRPNAKEGLETLSSPKRSNNESSQDKIGFTPKRGNNDSSQEKIGFILMAQFG